MLKHWLRRSTPEIRDRVRRDLAAAVGGLEALLPDGPCRLTRPFAAALAVLGAWLTPRRTPTKGEPP
ncbi:MAG: hypothetical protein HY720_02275 [Planctomycetes bacterium]|nr:hypothetical protein [Planctomycetota bacterium]